MISLFAACISQFSNYWFEYRASDYHESVHIQLLKELHDFYDEKSFVFLTRSKHILFQFRVLTRNQCPRHWSHLVSAPLPPFYLRMAVYQCLLSCLSDPDRAFRLSHLGQGRRARARWEIWVQTESVSTLSLREGRSLCLCESETTG